jgi:putative tricarboxylic transport membrane protein
MILETNRIAGLLIATLGLVLLFVVFPFAIEDMDDGSIKPDTVPNAIAAFLVVCGILLAIKRGERTKRDSRELILVLLYFAIIAAGLFAISHLGFLIVSPFLALAIMLIFGERRLIWLGLGCVGMPAIIWFLVIQVLERSLP